MSQQTFNVYIPNMEAPPNPPALASTSAPLVSGIIGGALSAVSAVAGGMAGPPGGSPASPAVTLSNNTGVVDFMGSPGGGAITADNLGNATGNIRLSNGSNQ